MVRLLLYSIAFKLDTAPPLGLQSSKRVNSLYSLVFDWKCLLFDQRLISNKLACHFPYHALSHTPKPAFFHLFGQGRGDVYQIISSLSLILGTDYTDYTVFGFFVVAIEMQPSEFLLRTILRRRVGFSFYLDALSEIDQ